MPQDNPNTNPWPSEIRLNPGRDVLSVAFDDGSRFELRAEYLRVESPSAEVQGHSPKQKKIVTGKEDVKIARLDVDSTRTKNSLQKIIGDFQEKKTEILIGTQMVAKGLDFDNVTLIGVINADTLLNYPDFRAFERSYQLLAQVAGRAGRRDKQGKVCIQAYDDDHRIIKQVVENNYLAMYNDEIEERKQFHYPPFTRLIFINVKHKDSNLLNAAAAHFAALLRAQLGNRVLGPEQPLVSRIRNYYIKQLIIKSDKSDAIQKVKAVIKQTIIGFNSEKAYKGVIIQIDVDPY